MRKKEFPAYSRGRFKNVEIPAPIIAGSITCQRSLSPYRKLDEEIRIDTGADISALPLDFKDYLGLEDRHAIYTIDYSTPDGDGESTLVFMVDFLFAASGAYPDFHDVHVIFTDTNIPLFGIWTGLEYVSPLTCDFRGMKTSFF